MKIIRYDFTLTSPLRAFVTNQIDVVYKEQPARFDVKRESL